MTTGLTKPVIAERHLAPSGDSGQVLPITLARLTSEFLDFACLLADTDPADAEAIEELEERLDGSAAAILDKAVSIVALIREFDARAAAAQAEADRIVAHVRTNKSRSAWLRDYLLKNLAALGVNRIETATTVVAVRQSPPSVEILDEEKLPDAFRRVVESIDKALLRTVLLDGEVIPGARLARGKHLWIR